MNKRNIPHHREEEIIVIEEQAREHRAQHLDHMVQRLLAVVIEALLLLALTIWYLLHKQSFLDVLPWLFLGGAGLAVLALATHFIILPLARETREWFHAIISAINSIKTTWAEARALDRVLFGNDRFLATTQPNRTIRVDVAHNDNYYKMAELETVVETSLKNVETTPQAVFQRQEVMRLRTLGWGKRLLLRKSGTSTRAQLRPTNGPVQHIPHCEGR